MAKNFNFLVAWVIIWFPIAIPLAWRLKWNPLKNLTLSVEQKLPLIISLYLLAPLGVWEMAKLEGETLADYGMVFNPPLFWHLGTGISLGIGILGLIFGAEGLLGWINWHGEKFPKFGTVIFPLLGLALVVGGIEELVFRGLFLNKLEQDYSREIAAILSSAIFALLHLVWERKNTLAQLPGLWLMGIVLVAARWVAGGNLGLAWGLHTGWVWAMASLDTAGLISYSGKGSPWLTGLGGQPLAGLAGILCMVITGIILLVMSH